MSENGGSLVGISSPGCTTQYNPQPGYDMPGSGKMEYAMRLIALKCADRKINCNVVIPGVTFTDAWKRLALHRDMPKSSLIKILSDKIAPMGAMTPQQIGKSVAFLCSTSGRWVTGVSLSVDGAK